MFGTRSYPVKTGQTFVRSMRKKYAGIHRRFHGQHTLQCKINKAGKLGKFHGVSKYQRLGTRAVEEAIVTGIAPLVEETVLRYSTEQADDGQYDHQYEVDDLGVAHA